MFSYKTLIFAVVAATGALGLPTILDVVNPPITSPNAKSVWIVGTSQNVTWDTSRIPASSANQTGMLLLGFESNGSENLDIDNPLATQFPIGAGSIEVTVPNVESGESYIVVLFGDSGNVSPEFTISGYQESS